MDALIKNMDTFKAWIHGYIWLGLKNLQMLLKGMDTFKANLIIHYFIKSPLLGREQ
ncbi:uncharacterized protein G2W53_005412 [Senna tora]|uniref:Uncharacterized protein n=1 Tax=Senna tora TaxID=362788 RepID=A0A834X218_9FABA|nr:uncharacterized protein G2W53_005412 [Senna tora]